MNKILKIIGGIILVLVLLALSIPYIIDINDYRQDISGAIEKHVGKKVTFAGDIHYTLFPWISVTLYDVSMQQEDAASDVQMHAEEFTTRFKLLPLLKGYMEVDKVYVHAPFVQITSRVRTNDPQISVMDGEVSKEASADVSASTSSVAVPTSSTTLLDKITLSHVAVEEGTLVYIDEEKSRQIRITDIELATQYNQESNPFSITANLLPYKSEGKIDIKGHYTLGDRFISVEKTTFKMGNIDIFGNLTVDVKGDIPIINISLNANPLDINPYIGQNAPFISYNAKTLEPKAAEEGIEPLAVEDVAVKPKKDASSASPGWSKEPLNFASLHGHNIHVNVHLKALNIGDFTFGETSFNAYLRGGRLNAQLRQMRMYQGVLEGKLQIDASGKDPRVTLSSKLDNMSLDLLPANAFITSKIGGTATYDLDVRSWGISQDELIKHMQGQLSFALSKGKVKGLDMLDMASNIASAFELTKRQNSVTEFDSIEGAFVIDRGVIKGNDLLFSHPGVHFLGQGEVNVHQRRVDYKLTPKLLPGSKLEQVRIPIIIRGDWLNPVYRLEFEHVIKDYFLQPDQGKEIVDQIKRDLKSFEKDFKQDHKTKPIDKTLKGIIDLF